MHHPVNPTCRTFLRGLLAEFGIPEVREAMKSRGIARLNEVETRKQWGLLQDVLRELDNPKPVEPPKPARDPADLKTIETLSRTVESFRQTNVFLLHEIERHERADCLRQAKRKWWQIF